jgi:hypothetical protein
MHRIQFGEVNMKSISDIPKTGKLYQAVDKLRGPLVYGGVLAVDPSIGSTSSSPGWAYYRDGVLIDSGIIFTGGSHLELWQRARRLGDAISLLSTEYKVDVLVYEDIPATSGFNQNAIASLLKAVGIVLACSKSSHVLGVHPASWKNYVRPEYKKGDKEDAVEIGWIATSLARHLEASVTESGNGNGRPVPRRKGKV